MGSPVLGMRKMFKYSGFVEVRGTDLARIRGEASVWLRGWSEVERVLCIEGRCVSTQPDASGRTLELSVNGRRIGMLSADSPGDFVHEMTIPPVESGAVLRIRLLTLAHRNRSVLGRIKRMASGNPPLFRGHVEIARITLNGRPLVDFTAGVSAFAPTNAKSVNVLGFFLQGFGVAESARCCALAARAAGLRVAMNPLKVGEITDTANNDPSGLLTDESPHRFNIFHLEPPQMSLVDERHGPGLRRDRYNIAFWGWEMPDFPDCWLENLALVDEVWVPSRFVWESIAPKSPAPVLVMPHAVEISDAEPTAAHDRKDAFSFLAIFDFNASLARKNPLGAIAAFQKAFGDDPGVHLILKAQNGNRHPENLAKITAAIDGAPNITLVDRTVARAELMRLQAASDCLVSLHRAEGFGLALAEAMQLGKPVIATGWSGNLEFMNATNACLVDHQLVRLSETDGPYQRGQKWAEPSVDHASVWMRRIYEDAALRERVGAEAKRTVREQLSPARIGGLYAARLRALSHWV